MLILLFVVYSRKLYHLIFRLTRLASQPTHPQVMAGEHKKLTEKYQQAKQEIQYSQTTLARVEMDMEKTKQELREAQIKNERSNQSQRVHEAELQRLEQEVEAWKDKYRQSEQDVITAEDNVQKAEDENKRLKYAIQEQDATKERLISAGADYERQEEQYNAEIDRLQVPVISRKIQFKSGLHLIAPKFNLTVQLFAGEVEQGAVCGGASPRGERTFRARRDEVGTGAGETAVPGGIELEPTRFQSSTSKMELMEERSASRIGDRRDGSNDRPRSR